jgi:hypothetical protein
VEDKGSSIEVEKGEFRETIAESREQRAATRRTE